jgi:predicted metalloprotease with PDZ domain
MKIAYGVNIKEPKNHKVEISLVFETEKSHLDFFLPVWSPGSYFVREYSRHLSRFMLMDAVGTRLNFVQLKKNTWRAYFPVKGTFKLSYEVYCHETSVRTSFIDESHAFLHGPSLFLGVEGEIIKSPTLEVKFPSMWSKISTGLKDISKNRQQFLYEAKDYDEFLDCPIEIGCHESDGFILDGKEHELAFYGKTFAHGQNLKKDMATITAHVANYFGELPYQRYVYITHFLPDEYGGLEHQNSTALHFDGTVLGKRKEYLKWISLVGHEYFHTWNVKRIRPFELGPFDYHQENYTELLWLAEGLTSFIDDLSVYQAGISTLEEYLDTLKENLNIYYATPGRFLDSVAQSSFNAWIKLYRPDENSKNSSISYYLKGGLIFLTLHLDLRDKGKGVEDLLTLLWQDYKKHPERGLKKEQVYAMFEELGGKELREKFVHRFEGTEDVDFISFFKQMGVELSFEEKKKLTLGFVTEARGNNLFVKSVPMDSAAYKAGINAGDEILAIDQIRMNPSRYQKFEEVLLEGKSYQLLIARRQVITSLEICAANEGLKVKELKIVDAEKAAKVLKFKNAHDLRLG